MRISEGLVSVWRDILLLLLESTEYIAPKKADIIGLRLVESSEAPALPLNAAEIARLIWWLAWKAVHLVFIFNGPWTQSC